MARLGGMYAALMVGASAPALLASLGKATTPAEVVQRATVNEMNWPPELAMSRSRESRPETAE